MEVKNFEMEIKNFEKIKLRKGIFRSKVELLLKFFRWDHKMSDWIILLPTPFTRVHKIHCELWQ